jgi:16S rRNA (uracil1498-N3)-methyltransferase
MSARYYINLPLCPGPITLDGPEAHHLAAVSRLRPGDEVCLFNGDGREYPARITQVGRRMVSLEIIGIAQPRRELPFTLEVAAPLPKGDRSQFMIEKLTELGVTRYVPLSCQRSVIQPREGKREKMERYVIEASKQCGRNVLMTIGDLTEWENYAPEGQPGEMRIIAHPGKAMTISESVKNTSGVIRAAVGPEGGFSDEEVAIAIREAWQFIDLGPRILRVETAAIVMAALVGPPEVRT